MPETAIDKLHRIADECDARADEACDTGDVWAFECADSDKRYAWDDYFAAVKRMSDVEISTLGDLIRSAL